MPKHLPEGEFKKVVGEKASTKSRGIRPQTLKETSESELGTEIELLELCVLRSFSEDCPDTLARAKIVQEQYQEQYRQILRTDGPLARAAESKGEPYVELTQKERTRIVFAANCRPVCFGVKKRTNFCGITLLCPWCFIRAKAAPARRWLSDILPEVANTHCLLSWERHLDIREDPDPFFFGSRRGPANAFSARRHVQVAIVGYTLEEGFHWRVIGFAVVPKITPKAVQTKMTRLYGPMKASLFGSEPGKPLTVGQMNTCFSGDFTLPVLQLHGPVGLETFVYLYRNRDRSKLYRKGGK
jgi:hypothetical protein